MSRYECSTCGERVCLLCASECHSEYPWEHKVHHEHKLRYVGLAEAYCSCKKDKCQALAVVDMREAEGYKYVPNPIDTTDVELEFDEVYADADGRQVSRPNDLGRLARMLARNSHEVWAKERMSQVCESVFAEGGEWVKWCPSMFVHTHS